MTGHDVQIVTLLRPLKAHALRIHGLELQAGAALGKYIHCLAVTGRFQGYAGAPMAEQLCDQIERILRSHGNQNLF